MSTKKILILLPYKARDLEGHTLVGYYLHQKFGFEVKYTNGYGIERKLLDFAPDLLVLDHLAWDFKVEQAEFAKELGIKVVVLPTEGLFQSFESGFETVGALNAACHLPEKYLAWGEWFGEALVEKAIMTKTQVEIVGCTRFDFYAKPFLKLMLSKEELLSELGFEDLSRPLILWATNTTYAARNPKKILRRYVYKAKYDADEVRTLIKNNQIQFRAHSKLIYELAQQKNNWNFIVKVHPAEWINDYLNIFSNLPNVRIVFDTPISNYLYCADVLLQRDCTTATEAWFFNKPVLNLEIGEYDATIRPEFAAGNHQVFDDLEVRNAIERYLNDKTIPPRQQQARSLFISNYFHKVDGNAAERSASIINDVLQTGFEIERQQEKNDLIERMRLKHYEISDRRSVNKLKDFFGISRNQSLRFWKKILSNEKEANAGVFHAEAEITQEIIDECYSKYDSVLNLTKDV